MSQPRIEVLDAEGCAALKPGDSVLVPLKVVKVDTEDSTLALERMHSTTGALWYDFADVYARMRGPIEVGDTVTVAPARSTQVKVIAICGGWAWVGLEPGDLAGSIHPLENLEAVS